MRNNRHHKKNPKLEKQLVDLRFAEKRVPQPVPYLYMLVCEGGGATMLQVYNNRQELCLV